MGNTITGLMWTMRETYPLMTPMKRLGLCGDRNDRFGRDSSTIESGVVGDR